MDHTLCTPSSHGFCSLDHGQEKQSGACSGLGEQVATKMKLRLSPFRAMTHEHVPKCPCPPPTHPARCFQALSSLRTFSKTRGMTRPTHLLTFMLVSLFKLNKLNERSRVQCNRSKGRSACVTSSYWTPLKWSLSCWSHEQSSRRVQAMLTATEPTISSVYTTGDPLMELMYMNIAC